MNVYAMWGFVNLLVKKLKSLTWNVELQWVSNTKYLGGTILLLGVVDVPKCDQFFEFRNPDGVQISRKQLFRIATISGLNCIL